MQPPHAARGCSVRHPMWQRFPAWTFHRSWMISFYFSGPEGLGANILAQVITARREANRHPVVTHPFSVSNWSRLFLGWGGERYMEGESLCCFHPSVLAFCLYLREMVRVWGSWQWYKPRKTSMSPHSAEQIGAQSNWACLGVLEFYFKEQNSWMPEPTKSIKWQKWLRPDNCRLLFVTTIRGKGCFSTHW